MSIRAPLLLTAALTSALLLAGCDQLGIESPQKEMERKEADAKAIGSACRQAGRAIEDCYNLNAKASKASVFAGWREMDEYMRENKLDVVSPTVPSPAAKAKAADEEADSADAETSDKKAGSKSAGKSADKSADKVASADKADKAEKSDKTVDKPAHKAKPKLSVEPAHVE